MKTRSPLDTLSNMVSVASGSIVTLPFASVMRAIVRCCCSTTCCCSMQFLDTPSRGGPNEHAGGERRQDGREAVGREGHRCEERDPQEHEGEVFLVDQGDCGGGAEDEKPIGAQDAKEAAKSWPERGVVHEVHE